MPDFMNASECVDELLSCDWLAVNLNPLGWFDQVRRRVQARPQSGRSGGGLDHRASRPFAVGTGNMNRSERILGIPERVQRFGNVLQPEFEGLDLVTERVKVLDGIGVAHLGVLAGVGAAERS